MLLHFIQESDEIKHYSEAFIEKQTEITDQDNELVSEDRDDVYVLSLPDSLRQAKEFLFHALDSFNDDEICDEGIFIEVPNNGKPFTYFSGRNRSSVSEVISEIYNADSIFNLEYR